MQSCFFLVVSCGFLLFLIYGVLWFLVFLICDVLWFLVVSYLLYLVVSCCFLICYILCYLVSCGFLMFLICGVLHCFVVSTPFPCGIHMETMGNNDLHGFHTVSMGGNDIISMWKPCGFHVLPELWLKISLETMTFVVSMSFTCCLYVIFILFPSFPLVEMMVLFSVQPNLTPKSCDHLNQPIRSLHLLISLGKLWNLWDFIQNFPPFKEQSCQNSSANKLSTLLSN